jgi:hypothetical protein
MHLPTSREAQLVRATSGVRPVRHLQALPPPRSVQPELEDLRYMREEGDAARRGGHSNVGQRYFRHPSNPRRLSRSAGVFPESWRGGDGVPGATRPLLPRQILPNRPG